MATEPLQGGPYPIATDVPDGPAQIKAVVDWAASRSVMRFATTAARDAALVAAGVAAVDGMIAVTGTGANLVVWVYRGGWVNAKRLLGSLSRTEGDERMAFGSNVVTTDASGLATITYPTPFASTIRSIVATTDVFSSIGAVQTSGFNPSALTSFQVVVLLRTGTVAASATARVNWIAVGI